MGEVAMGCYRFFEPPRFLTTFLNGVLSFPAISVTAFLIVRGVRF